MDTIEELKKNILEADRFIRQLDENIRDEAFKLLMGPVKGASRAVGPVGKLAASSPEESRAEEEGKILQRIGAEVQIPVERLGEIFALRSSVVEVVDSSIANDGPVDLLKKIALLCTYGNIIGRGIAKLDLSVIYKNLKNLDASTTSYSRDVKRVEGIKILSDGVAMLTPEGRVEAKTLLRIILRLEE